MPTTFTDQEMELLRALIQATYEPPIGLPYSSTMYSVGQDVIDSMWAKINEMQTITNLGRPPILPPYEVFTALVLKRLAVVLRERAALKNRSAPVGCALALALDETADAISSVVAETEKA